MICRRCLHLFTRQDKVRLTGKKRDSFRASVHASAAVCAVNLKPYKPKEIRNAAQRNSGPALARKR